MNEFTLQEVYEEMRKNGKDPDNWIQFCAFVKRNYIMLIN